MELKGSISRDCRGSVMVWCRRRGSCLQDIVKEEKIWQRVWEEVCVREE